MQRGIHLKPNTRLRAARKKNTLALSAGHLKRDRLARIFHACRA
jgi:hypothetical protein